LYGCDAGQLLHGVETEPCTRPPRDHEATQPRTGPLGQRGRTYWAVPPAAATESCSPSGVGGRSSPGRDRDVRRVRSAGGTALWALVLLPLGAAAVYFARRKDGESVWAYGAGDSHTHRTFE